MKSTEIQKIQEDQFKTSSAKEKSDFRKISGPKYGASARSRPAASSVPAAADRFDGYYCRWCPADSATTAANQQHEPRTTAAEHARVGSAVPSGGEQ